MLKKLTVLMCYVTDMDRSTAFYRDVCGLKPRYTSPHWTEFEVANGLSLALHPVGGKASKGQRLGQQGRGWTLSFQVDSLVAARQCLEHTDARIVGDYHEIPGGVLLSVEDPDGNPLDIVQMGITRRDLPA